MFYKILLYLDLGLKIHLQIKYLCSFNWFIKSLRSNSWIILDPWHDPQSLADIPNHLSLYHLRHGSYHGPCSSFRYSLYTIDFPSCFTFDTDRLSGFNHYRHSNKGVDFTSHYFGWSLPNNSSNLLNSIPLYRSWHKPCIIYKLLTISITLFIHCVIRVRVRYSSKF